MSKFYQRGAGRRSALENSMVSDIETVIRQKNADISEFGVATTPDELTALRTKVIDKFGSPVIEKDEFPKKSTTEPAPSKSSEPTHVDPEPEFEDPEFTTAEEPTSKPVTRVFDLSEFEPVKVTNAFEDEFPAEDMHKASSDFPSVVQEAQPVPQSPQVPDDSVPDAWELMAERNRRTEAIKALDEPESLEATTDPAPSSPEADAKVKLSAETKRKATESFARQMAKIFTFLSESGVKYVSKVKEKYIDDLEAQGLIDRNFDVNGKTVTELLESHNDLIDEMVKVDPQSKNDLIEAVRLVAEKHEIEVSPEANLTMVVVGIIISLGQAGLSQKREFKRTLKKISDTYTLQKRSIAPMQAEIERLRRENEEQRAGFTVVRPNAPYPQPEPQPSPVQQTPVKELSFSNIDKDLNQVQRTERVIEEESSVLDELSGDIDEGTVTITKNGKTSVKNGSMPAPPKKASPRKPRITVKR